ncbi:MAG TPA: S-layer homology domain-containing protein, partial [Syntrophomonadaceae bacterium]|nr:S-layer homology domain-containing protein [Syntrophomonadaceae bacterium]
MSGMMNRYRKCSYLILLAFILTMVLYPIPAYSQSTFSDIEGHWAQGTIEKMAEAGIISGNPDGSFKPDGQITRAEFATLVVKAFGYTGSGKVFNDTAQHWAKDYIAIASANGIVNGYSDTQFGPDDQITREQMAVMIVKAAQVQAADAAPTCKDAAAISSWARTAVATAYASGIIKGLPDGRFDPQGYATRAQAAIVIHGGLN